MKISYNWIKEYLYPINFNEYEISEILTNIGITVKYTETINNDIIFNIDSIPNRNDTTNHYSIAKNLYSKLKFNGYNDIKIKKLKILKNNKFFSNNISVFFEEKEKCIRYSGLSFSNLKIDYSPKWLIQKLESIGIKSINNITDIVNFVIYELGIPIHLFDSDQINGKKIFIKKLNEKIQFKSEDNILRYIDKNDIVISDEKNVLSIAGILNHIKNGIVHKKTNNIFLGIICLPPSLVFFLKKKYSIHTKNQFFLEKGIDPNQITYVLYRIIFLIKNIISSDSYHIKFSNIVDFYPKKIKPTIIKLRYKRVLEIIGENISNNIIKKLLLLLDISIKEENKEYIIVSIPTCRIDIKREIDLIEEILRIYGINNIKTNDYIKTPLIQKTFYKEEFEIQKIIYEQLIGNGFQEIISYAIRNYSKKELLINSFFNIKELNIVNSINNKNQIMRSSLIFSMIDCIKYNYSHNKVIINNKLIKLFELGKIYYKKKLQLFEKTILGIIISQKINNVKMKINNFFYLKNVILQIFHRVGIFDYTQSFVNRHPILDNCLSISYNKKELLLIGIVNNFFNKNYNIFYSELNWEYLISIIQNNYITYDTISKYPISRRDLSFLIDKNITFESINKFINSKKNKYFKIVHIYDIYEGQNISSKKKSYTASFFFENKKKTLTNKIINDSLNEIKFLLKKEFKAEIRDKI
ncbi:phenylalanine--tRNA ligase subunit beta [Blattabacterium cuenoti]|uniref:phenylalanine--tRNA ligase subunit beta n=1 Tax=Blattabacterium cuenoti TaxID=1653831 RepID=UPI00163D2E71|nr:phenylalanine--tRNA ligase subunit beta [Blattabacterium cuenoti]